MLANVLAEMGRFGLSYKDMYCLLEVSAPTFRGYLKGEPIPSDKLKKMSLLFDRTTDYLLEEIDQEYLHKEMQNRLMASDQ